MSAVELRMATAADVNTLARHRWEMFFDMGVSLEADRDEYEAATAAYFEPRIGRGEWFAWIAASGGETVGGAMLLLSDMPPRFGPAKKMILQCRQGLVMNVFVEAPFRRLGIARQLMDAVVEFAAERHVAILNLHASLKGRPLYEAMGFVPTNEMRLFLD